MSTFLAPGPTLTDPLPTVIALSLDTSMTRPGVVE